MFSLAAPTALVTALFIALSPLAPLALAAESEAVTWSVGPADDAAGARSVFTYAVDAGTQVKDTVVISNFGAAAATYSVYATDAINDFETGGFGLLPRNEKPVDVGSWITVDTAEVTLQPNTTASVPFTLLVPSDASPGDHVAGIVASVITDGNKEGQAVTLEQRVGSRIYLTVSGIPAATVETAGLITSYSPSWNPFAPGTLTVDYAVKNTGNLRLDVTQSIDATGPFGIPLGTFTPKAIENLLPGESVHVKADVTGIGAFALIWSTVNLIPGPVGSAATATESDGATEGAVAPEADAAGASANDETKSPLEGIEFLPVSAGSVSIGISFTLLLLTLVMIGIGYLLWRYVSGTRERLYDAIDEAAAEARASALLEVRANPAAAETMAEEPVAEEPVTEEVGAR